jgi:uncharacterized protein (TIGR00730 family)
MNLVYGGGNLGLMRHVADGALDKGGEVIGVMPEFLHAKEVAHDAVSEMIVVKSMHERKWRISQLSNAVIALPGGYGTLDEFFEMITWGQLALHQKPVSLLNINGFFDNLLIFLDRTVEDGFLKKENRDMIIVDDNIESLFVKLNAYIAPDADKWIKNKLVHGS